MLATVHIIGTGGTIASRSEDGDPSHGSIASMGVAGLLGPTLAEGDLVVTSEDLMTMGSYQLGLGEMSTIAHAAVTAASDPTISGVVVTHGTDTLEESAFLTELVNGTETVVVFTGAQRAADVADSDGPRNVRQALMVAADERFQCMGSLVCFDGMVFTARGTRKTDTLASQAFGGGTLVGRFRGKELDLLAHPDRREAFDLPKQLGSMRVDVLMSYPGSDPLQIDRAIEHGAHGIVLAGTGTGNAGPGYTDAVGRSLDAGVPIVLASRVPAGPVVPVYGNGGGVDLVAAGAIESGRLNPFQARILAACLLAQSPSISHFRTQFSALR